MKIFVVATRNQDRPAEDFAPLMDPEADYALKLYKEGFVREIYSRTDGKGALLVVESENEEKALDKLLSNFDSYSPSQYYRNNYGKQHSGKLLRDFLLKHLNNLNFTKESTDYITL